MPKDYALVHQITDLHLFADTSQIYNKNNPYENFKAVLNLANQTPADYLFLTGDFSQDESIESYELLNKMIASQTIPIYWLPGNHDDLDRLNQIMNQHQRPFERYLDLAHWQVVFLNSVAPGHIHGELNQAELAALEKLLKQRANKPTLVALHHHVLPIAIDNGASYMDKYILKNNDVFIDILKQYKQVKLVISGHVHMESEIQQDGIDFLTTPATAMQILRNKAQFTLDETMPGYRWLKLFDDGSFETGIERLSDLNC